MEEKVHTHLTWYSWKASLRKLEPSKEEVIMERFIKHSKNGLNKPLPKYLGF